MVAWNRVIPIVILLLGGASSVGALVRFDVRQYQHTIQVNGTELVVQRRVATNTLTQKKATYAIKISDTFGRVLYIKKPDVPFHAFCDDTYSNEVQAVPVLGKTGSGVAIMVTHHTHPTSKSTLDLLALRTKQEGFIQRKWVYLDPIVQQFNHRFVVPPLGTHGVITLPNDEWDYRHWTGQVYLTLPVRIQWDTGFYLPSEPIIGRVEAPVYRPQKGELTVYFKPTVRSVSAVLTVTPTSHITLMQGIGRAVITPQGMMVDGVGLRVDVNGRSGWVLTKDGFNVLGLLKE